MEGCNVWADNPDGTPGDSNHLQIQELKLPALEEMYVDHNAGGSNMGIEVPTIIQRIEATFNLLGFSPQTMRLIGQSRVASLPFHLRGGIRDRENGALMQATCEIDGRLGRVNPTAYQRQGTMHHEYSIRGITHYELWIGGIEIYWFDYFLSIMRIGGVDQLQPLLAVLGVSAGSSGVNTAPTQPFQPASAV